MVSIANLHFLPVKTQTTLKSPLEGHNLGPFHKPEEFLGRAMDNLTHEDWETNVNGMADKFKITFFFAFFCIKTLYKLEILINTYVPSKIAIKSSKNFTNTVFPQKVT